MNFLLDTNVISEWIKPHPDSGVVSWMAETDEDRIFMSAITLAELRHGVERLPPGARRKRLDSWLTEELPVRFEDRVLAVDSLVADCWGRIVARSQANGHPVGAMDALIAATAKQRGFTLVTRNVSDFEHLGVEIFNPWKQIQAS